jgi:hypothetical protein
MKQDDCIPAQFACLFSSRLAALAITFPGAASGIPTATSLEEIVVTATCIGLVGESRTARVTPTSIS